MLISCCMFLFFANVFASDTRDSRTGNVVGLQGDYKVSGERFNAENDTTRAGYAFTGLRYGTSHRFEHSLVNDDFSYLNNKSRPQRGYACPQHEVQVGSAPPRHLSMDEDCLYLDIYVPASAQKSGSKLPIMLWIYGGGFQFGDKEIYNGSQLAVSIDVIVIVINYRVDVWGFLSTESGTNTGNYGVGDARNAIRWTKKYIDKFGGDPNAITIFGESAGGVMVSALFLDGEVRTSVRAGIALSGSIIGKWTMTETPFRHAEEVAAATGCKNSTSPQDVLNCLKSLSIPEILNSTSKLPRLPPMMDRFVPNVDHLLIKDVPANHIANRGATSTKEATFITGYLTEDFSFVLDWVEPDFFKNSSTLDLSAFKVHVAKWLHSITNSAEPRPDLVDKVQAYYNVTEADSPQVLTRKLIWITTDGFFGYPAVKESFLYADRKDVEHAPNQLFRISYDPGYKNFGAFHCLDMILIFGHPIYGIDIRDEALTALLRDRLRQVAYSGRLDGPDFGSEGAYVELAQDKMWKSGTKDLRPLVQFWDSIMDAARKDHSKNTSA